jgi:hypothetical protein
MTAETHGTTTSRRWWALGVLSLAVIVIGMDNFILNLAPDRRWATRIRSAARVKVPPSATATTYSSCPEVP